MNVICKWRRTLGIANPAGLRTNLHGRTDRNYGTDNHPVYAQACAPGRQTVAPACVVSSDHVLLETLVGPYRTSDRVAAASREALWHQVNKRLLALTPIILQEAALLRASVPSLKIPDAIHAATAVSNNCALFITNDKGFRRIHGLTVAVLDDILALL